MSASTQATAKPRYTAEQLKDMFPADARLMASPEGDSKGLEDLRRQAARDEQHDR